MSMLGNVDGDQHGRKGSIRSGHSRSPQRCGCAKPLLRPETGYGHTLRYLWAARVAITSKQRFFPMCYGKEFTDRLFGLRKRAQTGKHEFDKLCAVLDIDHRLTPPISPQTNGMVERFNGRIEDVLQSHHFQSGKELEATLPRYVWLYNQQLPQSALGSKTPLQAMKDWHKLTPSLFKNSHTTVRDVTAMARPDSKPESASASASQRDTAEHFRYSPTLRLGTASEKDSGLISCT